jgi:hypothetical protein
MLRTGRGRLLLTLAAVACCAFLLRATYNRGLERGMDAALEWGTVGIHLAMACAITDTVYKFNLGYVCDSRVYDALVKEHTGGDQTEAVLPRLRDRAAINQGIKRAVDLGTLAPGTVDTGGLMTLYYHDLGLVDYIKVAFRFLGYKIEALYLLFFVLLTVSFLAFILAFHRNLLALAAAVGVAFGFFAEINSEIFTPLMPTVYGSRYPSVLAILPTLHIGLLIASRKKLTWSGVVLALPQVLLLIFAIKMRASAQWGLLAIFAVAALQCALALAAYLRIQDDRLRPQEKRTLAVTRAARTLLHWPLVLTVGLVLLNAAYTRSVLHPIYETDEVLPAHLFWHTLFINYAGYDFQALTLAGPDGPQTVGDEIGWRAAWVVAQRTHLAARPESLHATITHYGLRMALHDKLMRRAYLGYIGQHPLRALNVYLFVKPNHILRAYQNAATSAFPARLNWIGYGLCAAFAICLLLLPWPLADAKSLLIVLAAMAVMVGLPQWAGAPDLIYLADMLIVWPLAIYIGIPLLLALAIALAWRHPFICYRRQAPVASAS